MLENREGLSRHEPRPRRSTLIGSSGREGEKEGGPFAQLALHPDFATMRLHDVFDNRKPEASPSLVPGTRLIHSIKPLKNTIESLPRNARAIVPHKDLNFPAVNLLATDDDFALHSAVLDGIIH